MSRSWREQVRISLAPHRVAMVRLKRGALADRKVLSVKNGLEINGIDPTDPDPSDNEFSVTNATSHRRHGDTPLDKGAARKSANDHSDHSAGVNAVGATRSGTNWSGAIDALTELLAHPNIGRRRFGRVEASVILSNYFVRYLVLPWSSELITPHEELEFARVRFQQVFGEEAGQWRVTVAQTRAGAGRVCAAVDGQLLDAVNRALSGSPFQLRSIAPVLMSHFNAWRRQIGDDAWLVLAERGRVLIALLKDGEWRSVRTRPSDDTPIPLAQWLAQEELLLDVPTTPSKVCVSVSDNVAVNTEGVRLQMLSPRARAGFVPRADAGLLLAMTGAG